MKTNHTPEPWVYSEDCDSRGHYVGFGPVNKFVGETHISVNNFCTVQAKTNAHRIVACVNACKGFSNEDLEKIAKNYTTDSKRFDIWDSIIELDNEEMATCSICGAKEHEALIFDRWTKDPKTEKLVCPKHSKKG